MSAPRASHHPPPPSFLMRGHVRTFIIVGLTVGLMGVFFRNANLGRVWEEILGARWDLLSVGLLLTLGAYLLRVERWRHLLRPVGSTRFSTAFRATVVGFAANSILPGRVGEVLRPYVLARSERLSATAAFATIVVERLLDLLIVCLFFAGAMILFDPETSASDVSLLATMKQGAMVAGIVAVAALGAVFAVAGDPERAGDVIRRVAQAVPGGRVYRLTMFAQRFLEGLAVTRQVRPLAVALAWSLPLWMSIAASIWCVTTAFGIDMPLDGSVVLMVLIVIGVAVPTPAGIGGYHAAYQLGATMLYGASIDSAVGAALVMHLFSFGPITLLGLVFMGQDGLRLGSLRTLTRSDESVFAMRSGGKAAVTGEGGQTAILPVPGPVTDDDGSTR